MRTELRLSIDRSARTSLSEQIHSGIRKAIEEGVLKQGARLPSWQDLAAELGVARGTVRIAYDKLAAAQLIEASRAAGTRVAQRPAAIAQSQARVDPGPFMNMYLEMTQGPAFFQMGVPATDVFPATLFARLHGQAVRLGATAPLLYPDPRGELELRREIASFLAIARGVNCSPDQVIVTNGYAAGLGLVLGALKLAGHVAWLEEPSFPWSRRGVELAGLSVAPIPVDARGIDVEHGIRSCPGAKLAVVTPGQQAPLGHTLSLERRLLLLDWAAANDAWVVEDDYLSELQLTGRAAPALASLDRAGRVVHIGSFSKTISPALRLGFVIAPPALVPLFAEMAACLMPAPGPAVQMAVAEFIREGHYLRHIRRMKRLYASRQQAVLAALPSSDCVVDVSTPGLAVLLRLRNDISDVAVVSEALPFGLFPAPLSPWFVSPGNAQSGLLLGVANAPQRNLREACRRLLELAERSRR
ncbi:MULTISPECIES: PLP-dependent aminotransferase family protein [unclassified Rhizobium]|uniref:MocR-like pyridoxine biosynthesis transcription factor PdxR n=1 Tax=unclassified Rhizobium TaxID=2613769 RepID=UPI000BE9F8B3|nr:MULTISPECIES: PLP-dependent aminotransferase family protein [unclassified Rhizobium]MDF0663596.1 PLP-dependent aminotransferase family protein [Rhizobium sp. BC49]PDS79876.1 GntR family transcriptional regulator [Rhizobium sp. L18]